MRPSYPFGLQSSSSAWIPSTPRESYISEFRPNPKDNWMSDLRISSSKKAGVVYKTYSEDDEIYGRRYKSRGPVSPEKIEHRKRFTKLITGGDASKMA